MPYRKVHKFSGPPDRLEMSPKDKQWLESLAWDLAVDLGLERRPLKEVIASVYLSGIQHGFSQSVEVPGK